MSPHVALISTPLKIYSLSPLHWQLQHADGKYKFSEYIADQMLDENILSYMKRVMYIDLLRLLVISEAVNLCVTTIRKLWECASRPLFLHSSCQRVLMQNWLPLQFVYERLLETGFFFLWEKIDHKVFRPTPLSMWNHKKISEFPHKKGSSS